MITPRTFAYIAVRKQFEMSKRKEQHQQATQHLQKVDPVMKRLIQRYGPFALRQTRDRFALLVRAILSQQISTKAAQTIHARLQQSLQGQLMTADTLLNLDRHTFRSVGISQQKTGYLIDLSERVQLGRLQLNRLGRLSDHDVIAELIQVKGIGVWTAQMFLIFALGRLNVFPDGDLGIRNALRTIYELDAVPGPQESRERTAHWSPYATVGTWYCWRSVDGDDDGTHYPV